MMMNKVKSFFVKFFNLINFLINTLLIKIIHFSKRQIKEKSMLIIRLDSIGDYILVHNFFNLIRSDPYYKDYYITLCGNVIWKDLASYCNEKVFNDFIWLDKNKFKWNIPYKYSILKKIYQAGFEIAVETAFSREILFGDTIIKASKAKERIGSVGSPENNTGWKRKLFSDDYYTKLITQSPENLFEFYRNKEFFEKLLKRHLDINKPQMNFDAVQINYTLSEEFIVIVPGAQEKARRWSEKNFAELIKWIIANYEFEILLAGSLSEKVIIKRILGEVKSEKVSDISGKTTLTEFGKIISKAKLLISNETSAVHFAAAVNTPFICISNGQRFGRFMPYPAEMNTRNIYFYPDYIEQNINDYHKLASDVSYHSKLDINEISIEKIIKAVEKFLEKN